MITVRFYRIYDIGRDLDLDRLEESLARSVATSRPAFVRIKPKSIQMQTPPLQWRMDPVRVEKDDISIEMSTFVRLYDIGVISLCLVFENPSADTGDLERLALAFAAQEGLDPHFKECLGSIQQILSPHIRGFVAEPDFYEDYTIFTTDEIDEPADPLPTLLGDATPVADQIREETLKYTLSYTPDDRIILSYDSSLIYGPESPTDLFDLIEYANVQVFELRYYDRLLMHQVEKMFDDIEHADRMSWLRRMNQYHTIMAGIMETNAEITEVIEKVNNLVKVTEDIYYAKVYAKALTVFRTDQWSESVTRKIDMLRENYSMLSDEVRIQHSYFLEWVIIVLIALEFGFAIVQYLRG
jgi:hypothetical protein